MPIKVLEKAPRKQRRAMPCLSAIALILGVGAPSLILTLDAAYKGRSPALDTFPAAASSHGEGKVTALPGPMRQRLQASFAKQ